MAEINYINYGNQLVDLEALLNNMANEVQAYVNAQPWSTKRKQKFMNAYSDLVGRGLRGASNTTGQWMIDVGGSPITYGDKKDELMYGEAAYFILQLMLRLASAPKAEEQEEEKPELPKFGGTQAEIEHRIGNKLFGGTSWKSSLLRDLYEDPRGKNGLFGTSGRRKILADQLYEYSMELTSNPVDFTGSAFKDINDYQDRLKKTIADLKNPDITDQELKRSLSSIGLNYDDWFNNGSGDTYVDENGYSYTNPNTLKPYTYAEWNNYLNQLNAKKLELEKAAAEEKLKALDALQLINSQEVKTNYTLEQLANKYGGDINNLISKYLNKNIDSLTQEENDELVSLFRGGYNSNALVNISDEDWEVILAKLNNPYIDRNLYRKIEGFNGIYYDIGRLTIFQIGNLSLQGSRNFLLGLSDKEKEEAYLTTPRGNGIELTSADKRDIAATIADLGAFVSPGIATGTIAALSASGLRTYNSVEERGLWDTLTDWKTWADWGTGVLGGTYLLGDASSIAKFARGLGKIMTIPAIINAFNNVPEAKAAWDKIDSNNLIESIKKLTPLDYHAISSVLIGVLSGKNYVKGNLAERKVIEHSGYTPEQINASKGKVRLYAEKYGLWKTKVPEGEIKTESAYLKARINDKEDVELNVDSKVKDKIERAVNKAGNKESDRNAAVEKVLREEGLVGKTDKVTVQPPKRIADSKWNPASRVTRTTKELFETKTNTSSVLRNEGDFESWLNSRSTWDLYKPWSIGTNKNLRTILKVLGLNTGNIPTENSNAGSLHNSQPAQNNTSNFIPAGIPTNVQQLVYKILGKARNYKMTGSTKVPQTKGVNKSHILPDGSRYNLEFDGNKTFTFEYKGEKISITGKSLLEAKLNLGKKVNEIASKVTLPQNYDKNHSYWKLFESDILKLKKLGYFMKQGGKITDSQIDNFLKQYK